MYDAIIIGARVAGAPTAMLLARKGYRVLVVDRATFPSDTLSTHIVHVAGSLYLQRWGLLDKVKAMDCPPARKIRFDTGNAVVHGWLPAYEGVDAIYCPRRTLLDKMLVDAAREAGAEVREGFTVAEVFGEDGRIAGIRGRSRTQGGAPITERARIVIGADGLHSLVARKVQPPEYNAKPALTCAYYAYYSDVPLEGGEMYARARRSIGAWPTNEGLTMIYTAWPVQEFHQYRADIEGNFMQTVALAPDLAERVRRGKRAERFMGTADLPNFYRRPYGPGWALVGDAGYHKDPITGRGISDAFRDAELLAEGLDAGLAGRLPLAEALAGYEASRNAASRAAYEFTTQIASFSPVAPEQQLLFEALSRNQAAANRFFGALSGAIPMEEFFAPATLFRLLGAGGMAKAALGRARAALSRPHAQAIKGGEIAARRA